MALTQTNRPRGAEKTNRREIAGWAFYDVANSTFATVVVTTVYSAFFVRVIAGSAVGPETGTLLLGVATTIASLLIVLTAPVIGALTDATRTRKKALFISTVVCVAATAALGLAGPGNYITAMILLITACVAFGTGEDLVAAFLPEITHKKNVGLVSAVGWAAGYFGGLIALCVSLVYVLWAQGHNMTPTQYVPGILVICSLLFACASVPTFLWVKERGAVQARDRSQSWLSVAFGRLNYTFHHVRQYRDLFNLLVCMFVFGCGSTTIVQLSLVYADQTLNFTTLDALTMMAVVHVTSAIGALCFGWLQDHIGSLKTLLICGVLWAATVIIAYFSTEKWQFWIAANTVGAALGGTGSVTRALVSKFSPSDKSGEFLGLWGVAIKLATAVGPLTFGLATYLTGGDLRQAILTPLCFFIVGAFLITRVNEARGIAAAADE